jgi:preprotein translocase subunit SecB
MSLAAIVSIAVRYISLAKAIQCYGCLFTFHRMSVSVFVSASEFNNSLLAPLTNLAKIISSVLRMQHVTGSSC